MSFLRHGGTAAAAACAAAIKGTMARVSSALPACAQLLLRLARHVLCCMSLSAPLLPVRARMFLEMTAGSRLYTMRPAWLGRCARAALKGVATTAMPAAMAW